MSFKKWIEDKSIVLDFSFLESQYEKSIEETLDWYETKKEEIENFNYEDFLEQIEMLRHDYSHFNDLLIAINSKKVKNLFGEYKKVLKWTNDLDHNKYLIVSPIVRKIYNLIDVIENNNYNYEDFKKELYHNKNKFIEQSKEKSLYVKKIIEESISRIKNWNNSKIFIRVEASLEYGKPSFSPASSFFIELGERHINPSFYVFLNDENEIHIDDVLESGDTDFFNNDEIQSDYFNLINELKNPGSTSKGKNLILYTARPSSDRDFYSNIKFLPKNIFLTSDYNDAMGIAMDFGNRNVWRIVINSKYLSKTLDSKIKHYQVVSDNAIVKSIDLVN